MKYVTSLTLYSSYFDMNNRLTPKAILNIFQDVASIHGEELGVGYISMLEKNLYWVLSRIKFDILKMPNINQTVIIETWPHIKGKIDFDRDMRILSEDGEILVIATSKWCVIDTVKRMLQRTDNVNYLGECCLDHNYQEKFNKIEVPNENKIEVFKHVVRYSDLDSNKHMNNTNYAILILNAIENKKITHFEINFINECLMNDTIIISSIKRNDEEYVIGEVDNKTAFSAYIK